MDAMDLVRRLFAAANDSNLDEVMRWYDDDAMLDVVGTPDAAVVRGKEALRAVWALELGHRYELRRVAGIETGWGWVRADWVCDVEPVSGGDGQRTRGYSYFWIENARIRRQRSVTMGPDRPKEVSKPAAPPTLPGTVEARPSRGPLRPVFGVGAVVIDDAQRVLLVKRRHEPLAGQWSLPGGRLELGETLEAATAREILEETGLVVDVGPLVEVFDRILLDAEGQVQHHFVVADYLCRPRGGALQAGSDVSDVMWATPAQVREFVATEKARDVIQKALASVV